jgi:hypothetical protein
VGSGADSGGNFGDNDGMADRKTERNPLFAGRWFEDEVILLCLRWYFRFKLPQIVRSSSEVPRKRLLAIETKNKEVSQELMQTLAWARLDDVITLPQIPVPRLTILPYRKS